MTGRPTMDIVLCCWRLWWTRNAFAGLATAPPTGFMWDRPPGADAWIANTNGTVKSSKTFTCIHWSATPGNSFAAPPPVSQSPEFRGLFGHRPNRIRVAVDRATTSARRCLFSSDAGGGNGLPIQATRYPASTPDPIGTGRSGAFPHSAGLVALSQTI